MESSEDGGGFCLKDGCVLGESSFASVEKGMLVENATPYPILSLILEPSGFEVIGQKRAEMVSALPGLLH